MAVKITQLILLLAVAAAAIIAPTTISLAVDLIIKMISHGQPKLVELTFNLSAQPYDDLFQSLHSAIADNARGLEVEGRQYSVFAPRSEAPERRITLRLVGGERDDDEATLAVAEHDAYVLGFANRSRDYHTFRGGPCYSALPAASCTALPFGGKYSDLIGGLANLRAVPLGRASAVSAMQALSRYDPSSSTAPGNEEAKMALAKFMVMVTEAARLTAIYEALAGERWERETYLTTDDIKYVPYYGRMSYLITRLKKTGRWDDGRYDAEEERQYGQYWCQPPGGCAEDEL